MGRDCYLVSACLAGINCRYDGQSRLNPRLKARLRDKAVLLICPERLGGLPTPRPAAQICGREPDKTYSGREVWQKRARVLTMKGRDVTKSFLNGCRKIEPFLRKIRIKQAYLKARSPSCGCGQVYNRHPLTGQIYLVPGDGVLTALLKRYRIPVLPV